MRAAVIIVLAGLAACTDPQGAREAAEAYGLSDIRTGGYAAYGCGRDDATRTLFTATNVRGQRIEGVACSSMTVVGKATTVRIFRVLPASSNVPMAR